MKIRFPVKPLAHFERIKSLGFIFLFILGLSSIFLRFSHLGSPLIEPHPWRQTQTALTTYGFFHKQVNFWFYESPFQGKLWSFVFEFPLYQEITALLMRTGLGIEVSSRIVSNVFFLLGTVFLFLIVLELFSKAAALWTAFFYSISPFNIIFSRTALIDNFVQCLLLGSLFFFIKGLKEPKFSFWFFSTVLGALAAASKITIWFAPWAILGVFSVLYFYKNPKVDRKSVLLFMGIGLQLIAYLAWSKWTDSQRGQSGFEVNRSWIMGEWSARFELWRWIKIGKWVFRNILADWMVVPFFLGLGALRAKPGLSAALAFIVFAPLILFFNVYTYHDYYLIAQAPFLAFIAGLGMSHLRELSRAKKRFALISMGLLLVNHLRIVPVYLEPLFKNYSESLSLEQTLKSISSSHELLFVNVTENPWQIPLYSERLVATGFSKHWVKSGDLAPSLFYFPDGQEDYSLLTSFKTLGVVPVGNRIFFRVKETKEFSFDPQTMLILTDSPPKSARILPLLGSFPFEIKLCNNSQTSNSVFYELPHSSRDTQSVFQLSRGANTFLLPTRHYLSFPQIEGTCHFSISLLKGNLK